MKIAPNQSRTNRQTTEYIVRMERITKRFPGVIANHDVDLAVRTGTFHAVIGENGAGKSTLLNMLYGRYLPEAGRIFLGNEEVTRLLTSPAESIRRGVALVSQHYALIPALTVLENLMLGAENPRFAGLLRPREAADQVATLAKRLGLEQLDLNARADRLSVAAGQKVEILKALYRGARLLLLDEPTATLAPQEVDALFDLLHSLAAEGTTIVFVTHKLHEVMKHSDYVTVLRAGRSVKAVETLQTDEASLLRDMIGPRDPAHASQSLPPTPVTLEVSPPTWPTLGKQIDSPERFPTANLCSEGATSRVTAPRAESTRLIIEQLMTRSIRQGAPIGPIDLAVAAGEIVGVAGVDGSGQRELAEAIIGLRRVVSGRIRLNGRELQGHSVRARAAAGIAYIPEDRHRAGMVMEFSLSENYLLGHETERDWGGGALLDIKRVTDRTQEMLKRYDVRIGDRGPGAIAGTLSGGNQQKVVIARALDRQPTLLVACQPTRGLDVAATQSVYDLLRDLRGAGASILLFSLDLDEVFELSDRIAVMYNGRINGVLARGSATPEGVGALMTGSATIEELQHG